MNQVGSQELGDALRAVDVGTSSPESLLAALIALEPEGAVGWLLENADRARRDIADPELRLLVMSALERCRGQDTSPAETTTRLLEVFDDLLSADGLVAAIGELGPEDERVALLIDRSLDRWPSDSRLLRLGIESARHATDEEVFHARLNRLGAADPSQATMRWIQRMRAELASAPRETVRVALLSSFTIDPLAPYVDLELRRLDLDPTIEIAPFNSWAQEIISDDSRLREFGPQVAFLSVSIDDLMPELCGAPALEELELGGVAVLQQLIGIAHKFTEWSDGVLVIHSLLSSHRDPFGLAAGHGALDRASWLRQLNMRLIEQLRSLPRVHVLDLDDVLVRRAGGEYDNPKMRLLAGMRLVGPVLAEIARSYAGYVAAARGMSRKCVVVDLDNTLWGGIVGEDGVNGIRLGKTAPGVEYQEFQHYLSSLTKRGILVAINSKNNPDDALEVIRSHPEMILGEESFSAMRINWRPKHENILEIAQELNIGVDSMVFIDDNPNERELMRQMLPQVLTPELPNDPALYRPTLESLAQLQSLVVTDVDRARVDQYRSKQEREELKASTGSLDSYLASLDIAVVIDQANESTLPRIHQLFQRTNQFNLTTRRHDAGVLEACRTSPDRRLYTLSASDRFGDHGLVATALVMIDEPEWTIDSFLMSCRVISYGIESALLQVVIDDARIAGAQKVVGEYIETPKNKPAQGLYEKHEFSRADNADGVERWEIDPGKTPVPRPSWIHIQMADS